MFVSPQLILQPSIRDLSLASRLSAFFCYVTSHLAMHYYVTCQSNRGVAACPDAYFIVYSCSTAILNGVCHIRCDVVVCALRREIFHLSRLGFPVRETAVYRSPSIAGNR